MSRERLEGLLDRGQCYVGSPVTAGLAGATLTTAFFEPSTRTRLSFDVAAHRLGAHVMDLSPDLSSTTKGESFKDTILTLTASEPTSSSSATGWPMRVRWRPNGRGVP